MLLRMGALAKASLGEDLPAFGGLLTIKNQSYLGSRSMMPTDKELGKKLTALEGMKKDFFFFSEDREHWEGFKSVLNLKVIT